jgi:broad specificity phosphatase PhoE
MEIIFETHSTTVDNERGVATGWLDGALSDTGKRHAIELGKRSIARRVDAVFTSDLGPAVETARIAFNGSNVPVHVDPRLREVQLWRLERHAHRSLGDRTCVSRGGPVPTGRELSRRCVARSGLPDRPAA